MKALFIEPMLCVATSDLPCGSGWSYEVKLDGYSGLAIKAAGAASCCHGIAKTLAAGVRKLRRHSSNFPCGVFGARGVPAPLTRGQRPSSTAGFAIATTPAARLKPNFIRAR